MDFIRKYLPHCLFWTTCSLACMSAVPYFVNSLCMALWAALILLSAFLFRRQRGYLLRRDRLWLFLLFSGNYFFLLAGMMGSINTEHGLRIIEISLPMILFPFGFLLGVMPTDKSDRLLRYVLIIFHATTVLLCLWIFLWYWNKGLFQEFGKANRFNLFLRNSATKASDRDADYLSFYLAFAIYIAADRLLSGGKWLVRLAYGVSIVPMGILLLLLASRSPILGLIVGAFVVCFLRLKPGITRWAVSLSLLAGLLLVIRLTPAIYTRVQEMVDTPLKAPVGRFTNSTNLRVGIFSCTWQLISEHPLLGIGTGSDKTLLKECYLQFPTPAYQRIFYNSHDQYLAFWLENGIFALLLFLSLVAYVFVQALKRRDYTQLFFIILMSISLVSENILDRQAGTVFFYFFLACMEFAWRARREVKSPIRTGSFAATGL